MKFTIQHSTNYHYSHPVKLGPQDLRFYPREDGAQKVINFQLDISPVPLGRNEHLDVEGNRVTQVWFDKETDHFDVQLNMQIETLRHNAFDFILAPGAEILPINHVEDFTLTQGYLERIEPDNTVSSFAAEFSRSVNNNTLDFLNTLNQKLFADFVHIHRESGIPQTPAHTLHSRHGACRDLTVLFIDICRSEGIAARFVSGYQKGDLQSERRHLHAWPEVYLPGAGWIGFDPTHGVVIADTHVTIAAAAHARDTMPVIGSFNGKGVTSTLNYMVQIQVSES